MKRFLLSTLALSLLSNAVYAAEPAAAPTTAVAFTLGSGIIPRNFEPTTRGQDNFFRHAQGGWLRANEIPADKSDWGSFMEARENVQRQLHALISDVAKDDKNPAGTEKQKIADLFNSFMNEEKLETLGAAALKSELDTIAAVKNKEGLAVLFAQLQKIGVTIPFRVRVEQDSKQSSQYIVDIAQSGLGLPNRDYYLKTDDKKMSDIRAAYLTHVEKILTLAGDKDAAVNAKQVLAIETELAKAQWTNVENRDPLKTYNKMTVSKLDTLAPGYQWKSYFQTNGIAGKADQVLVQQPSYLSGFSHALKSFPLSTWKSYAEWQLLSAYSPYLSSAFANENFAFRGTTLAGIKVNRTREQRAVALTDQMLGEAVGKLYVEKYFAPETKVRTEKMVKYFLAAFKDSIDSLDWMSAETKKQAQIKLSKISVKIGYPEKWKDYSAIQISKDDLAGNLKRIRSADFEKNVKRLGTPVDRSEWHMTPQTVNAYYSPEMNEIVFPAARLQAPLFNVEAEDAVNYGALGISIGHEISHAFDDAGSQYDGDGNLRDWWTKEDREKFNRKTKVLVEQYNGYSPVPGHFLNGELTLGENIADNVGIVMALKAYRLSLEGKPSPILDGWSGEQRLFLGLAQARRSKSREQRALALIKTDPHSPGEFRVNGSLRNNTTFYDAFNVKPGDGMYLPENKRVSIW
ncbi:M13 family metallopeptidase [Undibacterium sp. CY21W]|uniref:M13 family metallopeptidase n=1 Tax=Undibacterium sp. CY21W TaxID=2762293 RepID=UPI00164C79B7|nr:M13 family metallopeptidase [Undibacterium sp. CY21W]MBC3927709.1 M13 family metallopeptidase [Undibacterium sp. CY21W]